MPVLIRALAIRIALGTSAAQPRLPHMSFGGFHQSRSRKLCTSTVNCCIMADVWQAAVFTLTPLIGSFLGSAATRPAIKSWYDVSTKAVV